MLYKNFNKWGDTSFRVKNQIVGYTNVLFFLKDIITSEKNINKLNDIFIDWCKIENIYYYKNNNVVKNRFSFILKFFKSINIFEVKNNHIEIKNKHSFELFDQYVNDKKIENWFFNNMYENFNEFKCGIDFALRTNDNINVDNFLLSILVFDYKEDDFDYLYNYISNNKEQFFYDISKKYLDECKNYSYEEKLIKSFRKINHSKKEIYKDLIISKKENNISNSLIYKLINDDIFKLIFLKLSKGNFLFKNKNKKIKENEFIESIDRYLKNASIDQILLDIITAKNIRLLNREYLDINTRWLNNLNLISQEFINKENIKKYIENKVINSSNDVEFPYRKKDVYVYLNKIQENDYSFKMNDANLKEIPNSTIAEYFVNLWYSFHKKMTPIEFKEKCRTIFVSGTLFPYLHAPGGGPDMFYIDDNKLIIIETTIHKTSLNVLKNEVFSIAKHIDFDVQKYIKNKNKYFFKNKEIILITNLKNDNEFLDIKLKLSNNIKNKNTQINVTNFTNFSNDYV